MILSVIKRVDRLANSIQMAGVHFKKFLRWIYKNYNVY